MWRTYYDTAGTWFKNAIRIVDKYHWIRQVIWAFENVRKEEQKKFSKTHRRYFKNSKKLLLKRFNKLENEQQQQVLVISETSVNLSRSHWYKEKFLEILDCNDRETAKEKMQKCADSMQNWLTGILNSFSSPHTNGFTEGCNNKIKVLKRNAYGYKNFRRFRNRILHIFSHMQQNKEQAAAY